MWIGNPPQSGKGVKYMNIQASIALDVLSIVYVLILFLNLGHKTKKARLDYQYFWIMGMVCAFLALDAAYFLFYGKEGMLYQILLLTIKSLYLIVNCLVIWLWARYIDYTVFGDGFGRKKHRILYDCVLLLNSGAVLVNVFTGFLFSISPQGTFVVGFAAMWTFTILNYLTVIMVTVIVLKHKEEIQRNIFLPLLLFPLPPACAELIQIFFRPLSLICSYSISALLIFQISQNNAIYTDELSGLANRRMLNEHLSKWFSESNDAVICGIMIDLDGLKLVNDTYGHLAGDRAIVHMAELIKSVERKDILGARYGGDEFVLIWLSEDEREIQEVKERLEENKAKLNRLWPPHEQIDFSIGTFCCRDRDRFTAEDFLRQMDENMYQVKKEKKSCSGAIL